MTDLDRLIDDIERGTWPGDTTHVFQHAQHVQVYRSFNGSLNDALALHEAMLPDWDWNIDNGLSMRAPEAKCIAPVGARDEGHEATGNSPARAWLLSILRAYRSMQEEA